MSNETINNMNNDKKSVAYGAKLKAAREAIGLEQKDIAAQLRLGERIIEMLESGHYASDVPTTFIRGYIRSYSKLLQIPDSDITAALEPIKPMPAPQEAPSMSNKQRPDWTSSSYYMQFSTYAIVATLTGMIGLWWYNHAPAQTAIAQNQTISLPEVQKPTENKEVASLTPSTTSTPNATTPNTTTAATAVATAATTALASATPAAQSPSPETKPASAEHAHPVTRSSSEDDDDEDESNHTD